MLFPLLISVVRWKEDFVVGHLQILIFENVKNEHSVEKFLWLTLSFWTGVSSLLTVEKHPALLWFQEGESPNFTCSFPSSSFYALHWYRWEPVKSPKNLFVISVNGDENKQGWVRVTLNTKEGYSSMYVRGSQPEDSATYLCASTQCPSAPCSPYPKPCLLLLWDQHWGRAIVGRERKIQWMTVFLVIRGKCKHR